MAKKLVKEIRVYRDDKTGIAWVENGSGLRYSCHPNIDVSGSVEGMKSLGYWGKDDIVVRSHGFQYNISRLAVDEGNEFEMLAAQECMCQVCIRRRKETHEK